MREDVLIAGVGGQGVLLAGRVLAHAAIESDLAVSWYPSYSPEVRGGTVECTVVVADGRVGSPVVGRPRSAVFVAASSFNANADRVIDGGLVVVNGDLSDLDVQRDELRLIPLDATRIAKDAGSERALNMVVLGAYVGIVMPQMLDALDAGLESVLPDRHKHLLGVNQDAIRMGAQAARETAV